MISSQGRLPTLKHHTKTFAHKIANDNTPLSDLGRLQVRPNHHMVSPIKQPSSARTLSKSKHKKQSIGKLFAKAHQTNNGQTYLPNSKEAQSRRQTRSTSGHCSDCAHLKKAKSLQMCRQFNIKIGEDQGHSISLLIEKFGLYEMDVEGLSSIAQNSQESTLTSSHMALIELIVKS